MVEVAARVIRVVADERAVVVEGPELAGVVLRGVVGREVYDDLDAVCVRGGDEVVEVSPGVRGVAEVLLDALEVAPLVAVIRGGGVPLAVADRLRRVERRARVGRRGGPVVEGLLLRRDGRRRAAGHNGILVAVKNQDGHGRGRCRYARHRAR